MDEETTFFKLADQLDKLIPLQVPNPEQVKEVVLLIEDEALEQYFFKHLAISENPAWFDPLRQQGLFDTPPEPIEREGTVYYSRWSALRYLVAIAPELPEAIVEIAGQISAQDPFIFLELVRAAQRMPPELAARMVPLIVRWADEGMEVAEDIGSLAFHLAKGNQWRDTLKLVELILSPKEHHFPNKTVPVAERYYVQGFVEQQLIFFLEKRPLEILEIVQGNLERALRIEGLDEDTSSIWWRPAIETHEQNWGRGEIKDLLVDATVKALAYMIKNMPDQGRVRVESYLKDARSIFRRLAIHSIRVNRTLWPDLVEGLFVDERYLNEEENRQVYHEYWILMHEVYGSLPVPIQDAFAERLLKKLPPEQAGDQDSYHPRRHWVLRYMWAIKDFLSLDESRDVLAELLSEYGEPDHPSFLSYSRTLVGSVSSKTPDDIVNMPSGELLEELKKEVPFESFDKPDQEGLADALKAAVIQAPARFAPIAPKLFGPDIPPIYTYYALWGFRESWKDKDFDWEPVLELCDKVSKTREQRTDSGDPPDMMPGYWMITYASARSAAADLIEVGVIRDEKAIPSELLPHAKEILLILANDANPSPEYEQARISAGVPYDVLTIALNVTRGKAIIALIHYALHVARTNSQEQEQPLRPRSRMDNGVRDRLTKKLDKQVDPSLAIHSLFGKYLPNLHYLDKEWLISHLDRIFPRQPEMADYWEAAWDGYMFRGDFFGYIFKEMLKPYYRYSLEQMALGKKGRAGSELSRGRLAQHFAGLYWRGMETLDDDDSLVVLFFDSAPDESRASFMNYIGGVLRKAKPEADSEEWSRTRALLETRLQSFLDVVDQGGEPNGYVKELSAFTRWVPFIPGDIKNFYSLIKIATLLSDDGDVNKLVEFLSSVAPQHAPFAVSLLEMLLKQRIRGSWFLRDRHSAENVRKILVAAMNSEEEDTKSCAERVVNLFGKRGDERHRDLLDSGRNKAQTVSLG